MKNMTAIVAIAVAVANLQSLAHAAELPDCKLYKSPGYERGGTIRPRSPTTKYLVLDAAVLKPGQDIAYAKDDPILDASYQIVTQGTSLVATGDFVLKASWLTNPDFKFRKGQTIRVTRELVSRDGTATSIYQADPEWAVFLTPDGEFCNRAVITRRGIGWNDAMGHWSRTPDDARLQWQEWEQQSDRGRLRIVYTGTTDDAMHFQETWFKNTQIISSFDRAFSPTAKTVQIAGLTFNVSNRQTDSAHVSYEFGPRLEIPLFWRVPSIAGDEHVRFGQSPTP